MDDFSMYGTNFDHYVKCCNGVNICTWSSIGKRAILWCKRTYPSHIVSNKGIEVDKAKVELIEKLSPSTSVKGVRSSLGHVEFYWRFIKDFSKITKALTQLLGKDVLLDFFWHEIVDVFHLIKTYVYIASSKQMPSSGL